MIRRAVQNGEEERRLASRVTAVRVRAGIDELVDHVCRAKAHARPHQGGPCALALTIDVGTRLDQDVEHLAAIQDDRELEGAAFLVIPVIGIRTLGEVCLDRADIALGGASRDPRSAERAL